MTGYDLDKIRRERDGDRGPTMSDMERVLRSIRDAADRYRKGDPVTEDVPVTFDRWGSGWGSDHGSTRRPRPRDPVALKYTAQHRLDARYEHDPEMINSTREVLASKTLRWCEVHGYVTGDASWETIPDGDVTGIIIRLTVELTPRTDGEWPALHQAIKEDQLDRDAAKTASTSVDDRLDALSASAAVWSNPDTPEAW